MVQRNYLQFKQDVQEIVQSETQTLFVSWANQGTEMVIIGKCHSFAVSKSPCFSFNNL